MSKKKIYNLCESVTEKSVPPPGVTVFHPSVSLVMPNGDPRDELLYPILTLMSDSYSIDRVGVFIYRIEHS